MPYPPSPLLEPTIADDGVLRPTHLEVDLGLLAENMAAIQRHVGAAQVMPVVKANAYGHGMARVARHLESAGARCFGVAFLEEAMHLRQAGVCCDVLVMGGVLGAQLPLFLQHGLIITASSVDKLHAIEACAEAMGQRARVHLKVDTGMERLGVHWYSAGGLLDASLRCKHVDVEGIFSHFANADAQDLTHARLQLERFEGVLDFYRQRSLPSPTRHIANSGAVMQLPESWLDMVRPGILLYGVRPDDALALTVPVRPALRWLSKTVYFKVVQPGSPVSYGSTWAPSAPTRLVTIPVGYGDGYPRAMSGKAQVLVRGRRYPVRGRICMDQAMVDIGGDSAYNGDEVVLLGGASGGDGAHLSVEELSGWAGTIPYEILTGINTRVPRVYMVDGVVVAE